MAAGVGTQASELGSAGSAVKALIEAEMGKNEVTRRLANAVLFIKACILLESYPISSETPLAMSSKVTF